LAAGVAALGKYTFSCPNRFASPEVMIKALLESTWRALGDSKLKEVYQPAYDLAKKRFGQEKVYFPSAATPAAKIISLALTESELFDLGI
jgi:hypothetical protein